MLIFFTDKLGDMIKFTVKDSMSKVCVISLKTLYLDNIEDQEATLEDLTSYVKHTILERGEEIILDPETEELYSDWPLRLNEFIDSEF